MLFILRVFNSIIHTKFNCILIFERRHYEKIADSRLVTDESKCMLWGNGY